MVIVINITGRGMDNAIIDYEKLSKLTAMIYNTTEKPDLWLEVLHELDELTMTEKEADHTQPIHQAYLQHLHPHMQQALMIDQERSSLKSERNTASDILDILPVGIILVDSTLIPQTMNDHAQATLKQGGCITIKDKKLVCTSKQDTEKLHLLIHKALDTQNHTPEKQDETLVLDAASQTYSLCVTNYKNSNRDEYLAVIFITCPIIRQHLSPENLAKTYQLTPTEAKLLHTLLEDSHNLTEVATKLHLSKHTVRAHLKSILKKTACNSQVELIKKVLHSPMTTHIETPHITEPPHSNQFSTLLLYDKRMLEYTEYGSPQGVPVLYFHALTHSRKQFHPFSNYAKTNGIRIIAPERPGFGASSKQDTYSLTAYTKDIEQLLTHLNIERFYILGTADGAAAALACAHHFQKRVIQTSIVSGVVSEHISTHDKIFFLKRSIPKRLLYPLCKKILKILREPRGFQMIEKNVWDSDKKICQTPEFKALLSESLDMSNEQENDFLDDYFASLHDWDFSLQDTTSPVNIWHGQHDYHTNIKKVTYLAQLLPNCTTHFLEDYGHCIFFSHIDKVLEELIDKKLSAAPASY